MDYEKKYKDAMARLELVTRTGLKLDPTYIFPELKESEDERIRKALIQGFNECLDSSSHYSKNAQKYWHGIAIEDVLAWLEKQGEKLPVGFYYVNSEGKKFYSDTFKYGDVILHVEKQGEKETLCNKCRKEQPSHSCQDITALGRCAVEHEQKPQRMISAEAKEALYNKPSWSEEDEERFQSCLNILRAKGLMGVTETINTKWLKSLKERIGGR